ncbi:hypothetical protein BTVI_52391 [Pitangus sulphuratus]|nr:hypothetical protein BTVI_52391 [Pitangus sulphuratus]
MKLNKAKFKVLHRRWGSLKHKERLVDEGTENSPEEKDVGVLVDKKLKRSWQHTFAAQQANHFLGYVRSSMTSRSREGLFSSYSTPVRPHLECCIQLWGPT